MGQMALLCVARFGNSPSKVIIDATWTSAIPSPASPAPTCALLALDGSLRLATAGTVAANRLLNDKVDGDDVGETDSEYQPTSQFEFGGAFSTETHTGGEWPPLCAGPFSVYDSHSYVVPFPFLLLNSR